MRITCVRGIAATTARDGVRQPIFLILVGLSVVLIWLSLDFTLFGLGEVELNMMRETGLSTMRLLGLVLAIFLGLGGFCEEIERRRLFTVLSKPVRRADVIIGRYLGVLAVVGAALVIDLIVLLGCLWWKEGSLDPLILVGTLYALVEGAVLLAVAHFLAVFAPFLPGAVACLGVFSVGHLSNWLVGVTQHEDTPILAYALARTVMAVFPNLQHFDVLPAVSQGHGVSGTYVFLTLLYAVGYIAVTLGLAIVLFERREVA